MHEILFTNGRNGHINREFRDRSVLPVCRVPSALPVLQALKGSTPPHPIPLNVLPPFIAKSYLLFAILWIACLAVSNVSHDEAYELKWVWGSTAPAILMLAVPYLSGTTTPERLSMTASQVALQISGYNFVWTHKQWGHAKIYTISVTQDGAIRVAESQAQESVSSSPPASGPSTLQSSLSTDTWIAVVRIYNSQLNAKKPLIYLRSMPKNCLAPSST
jgi:hypothetical protein